MDIKINKEIFSKHISNVARIVSFNNTSFNFNSVLLKVEHDKIFIIGSNVKISYMATIDVSENLIINKTGIVLINTKPLNDIVKKIDEKTINLKIVEENILTIQGKKVNVNLNILSTSEYSEPVFDLKNGKEIILNFENFKKYLQKVNFIINDQEKRIVLTGVNFEINDTDLVLTATDSFRLAQYKQPIKYNENKNFIIPSNLLSEVLKITNPRKEDFKIIIKENQIFISIDNDAVILKSKIIEGKYPDVSNIIPSDFSTIIKINRREIIKTIDLASTISNDYRSTIVNLEITKNAITIRSQAEEIGNSEELIEGFEFEGNDQKISFNSKYLIDALASFDESEFVSININNESKPITITSKKEKGLTQLVLPVRFF